MAKLVVLGSAFAIPDEKHENTHFALVGDHGFVMIDCAANPVVRLKQAGLDFQHLTDLILTHFHPDHVYGTPLLLMDMWLMGRQAPLRVYGLHHCLQRMEDLMAAYHWDEWPNFFPIAFHRLPERENMLVLDNADFRIISSPVRHLVPTIGLRIESKSSGKVMAYSCDTEPCPEFLRLAAGADLILHDSAGATVGHSSASQAGGIARDAKAKELLLIHYDVLHGSPERLPAEAAECFDGPIKLAEDFDVYEL